MQVLTLMYILTSHNVSHLLSAKVQIKAPLLLSRRHVFCCMSIQFKERDSSHVTAELKFSLSFILVHCFIQAEQIMKYANTTRIVFS
jgi:hypothetical protein